MNRNKSPKRQRLSISILLSVIISVQLLGFFAFPRQVKATGVPVFDAANFGQMIKDGFVEVLTASALGALLNGASYFMRKVAYDTASYIANGGKGQSALVFKKGWGSYLEDVSGNAAATAVDQLGKPFGLDLCKMPSASFQVDLQIGLRSLYDIPGVDGVGGGPEPNCSFQKLKDGWKDWDNMEKLQENALGAFNASLTVSQSDFGIALNAIEQVDRIVAKQRFEKIAERGEGDGFKGVTDAISGNIKTPAAVVAEESKALSGPEQTRLTMGQIAGVYGSGALQIIPMAGSVFLNTLISQGLNNLFTKGLVPDDKGKSAVVDFYAQSILNNKKAAEKAFNYLFTAVPKKQLEAYDALTELETCSDNPGLNNCVIDGKFREAIYRAKLGRPLTIRDALKEKLLEGNKPLISPLRAEDNTNINCRQLGYCYSNLQKLRKLRVVPLGFELAALRSDPDQPWTLQQVVDGFEDCSYLNNDPKSGKVIYDAKKPFCHLIDPNWIIRLPEARCESKVYGPILMSASTADRREECVDITTCITEGPNGECIDDQLYAYCTKEKNIWSLGANACSPQYNTCKSYVDTKGTVRSYLSRTVDYGSCGAQAVGCAAYSLEKKGNTWLSAPQVTTADKKAGRVQMAFFNKTIANYSCPSDAEGCSAFYAVTKQFDGTYKKVDGPEVNLKKASDFLGCYDVDPAPGVQYPKTSADLAKISTTNSAECKKFAAACLPEETACQSYTPSKGGPAIPGIIGANGCAAACVGYDTFQQEPTQFDTKQYPLYFVPSEGASCDVQHSGCTEFTNLSAGGSGGEALAYFTSVKYCEKPTDTNLKTYYSWEGDSEKGYVLKVHKLRPFTGADIDYISFLKGNKSILDAATVAEFVDGTPAYADDNAIELEKYGKSCNETLYNAYINGGANQAQFDPDCRAFYDEAGKVSYRLLAKTISVSESCSDLRRTEAQFYDSKISNADVCTDRGGKMENGTCMRCAGGGKYKNDNCVYSALVGDEGTVSCPAVANGCREYTGNAGNNTAPVLTSDFEGQNATDNWSVVGAGTVSLAAESIQVGLHSLQVNAATVDRTFTTEVTEDGWYELSFWVRGVPQTATVSFAPTTDPKVEFTQNPQTKQSNPISINNTWRLHRLGPVFLPKGAKKTAVRFERNGSGVYFLDSLELRKVTDDTLFLIKDSWKKSVLMPDGSTVVADAPIACDADPTDVFPGAALGCSAYKDANGKTAYATGFEQLCREEAIGCQALVDTFNTIKGADAEKAHVYNAVCVASVVAPATTPVDVTKVTDCTITIAEKPHTCKIQIGEKSCVVEDFSMLQADLATIPDANITASTIIIPADTPITEPIFLTNRKEFRCSPEMLGCVKVAKQEQKIPNSNVSSYAFASELFVKNSPANYAGPSSILCDSTQVGCSEFNSDDTKSYFKDPLLSGNTLCEYQDKVTVNGNNYSGWFKSGVGKCEGNETLCRLDTVENDCGKNVKCTGVGEVQCYSNYLDQGGQYGIWSNKAANYDGYVASCPDDQNQCTELVDPQDKPLAYPQGKPYYVIFDEQIKDRQSKCASGASLDEGCVLFDKTEDPNKKYSSLLTYSESVKNGNKPIPPKTASAQYPGDTNVVISVDRDRQCSEWLSCSNSMVITDKETGIPQRVCYDYRACLKMKNGQCIKWKKNSTDDAYLSEDEYVGRDTSWYAEEFTGYSLLNKYQVHYYSYITVSSTAYAVYKMDEELFTNFPEASCVKTDAAKTPKDNWVECGFAGENGKGRCYQGSCIYPVTGGFPSKMVVTSSTFDQALDALGPERFQCKAYPEATSPFSSSLAKKTTPKTNDDGKAKDIVRNVFETKTKGYGEVNVCQNGDCSCAYTKVEYKGVSEPDYWKKNEHKEYGICQGGKKDGAFCDTDEECGGLAASATCAKISRIQTWEGLKGLCLEEDGSRIIEGGTKKACLTWLPIDVGLTGVDNYNNDSSAGYNPGVDSTNGGEVYCVASFGAYKTYDSSMFIPSAEISSMVNNLGFTGADAAAIQKTLDYGPFGAPENNLYDYSDWDEIVLGPLDSDFHALCLMNGQCNPSKKYTFQQIVYSTMLKQAWFGGQIKSPNTSMVWFVDDTYNWLKYAQDSYKTFGSSFRGVNSAGDPCYDFKNCSPEVTCGDSIRAEGKSLLPGYKWACNYNAKTAEPWRDRTGMKYFRSLKDMPISEEKSMFVATSSQGVYESTVQQVYLSPIILPFAFDKGSYDHAAHYANFNEVYLDFTGMNNNKDQVITIPMTKERSAIGKGNEDYTDTRYLMFEKKGDVKIGNSYITRYALILSLSANLTQEKATELLDSYLTEVNPDNVKNPSNFQFVVAYVDFDSNDKIIMQSGSNNTKKPFYAALKGSLPHTYPGSSISTGNVYLHSGLRDNPVVASTIVFWPFCSAYEQVYNVKAELGAGEQTDKAWTNRVWSGAQDIQNYQLPEKIPTRDATFAPYATTNLSGSESNQSKLSQYIFSDISKDARPLTCENPIVQGLSLVDFSKAGSVGLSCGITSGKGYSDMIQASDYTDLLFVKEFSKFTLQKDNSSYLDLIVGTDNDLVKNKQIINTPPQIYSLNPATCFVKASGKTVCTAGEANNITINQKNAMQKDYNDDGLYDEDPGNKGLHEAQIGIGGMFTANAKFFAFADDNQMPIKRIMINWDDGTPVVNADRYGKYKNRKPYCAVNEGGVVGLCGKPDVSGKTVPSQLTCATDNECATVDPSYVCLTKDNKDPAKKLPSKFGSQDAFDVARFGNQPRACEPAYFEFNHVYTCNKGSQQSIQLSKAKVSLATKARLYALNVKDTDEVCVFQPGVQIMDNWGWCNGVEDLIGKKPTARYGGVCNFSNNLIHFTQYKGQIVVIPEN